MAEPHSTDEVRRRFTVDEVMRMVSAGIYATAGVPVYWRLDLPRRGLEGHEGPDGQGAYTMVHILDEQADIALPGLPGPEQRVKVADLLPARH